MALAALGQDFLLLAALSSGGALLGALLAVALPGRERLVAVTRRSLYGAFALTAASAGCLLRALAAGDYDLEYVYHYSERYLPVPFRLAGLWAGVSGSLLFWSLVLSGVSALAAWRLGRAGDREATRRLAPWTYAVLAAVTGFFVLLTRSAEPFRILTVDERLRLAETPGIEIGEAGNLLDGAGLNQQLVTGWFVVHPPALYAGFIVWTVPYALALAGLFSGEFGPWWLRTLRAWSLVAWTFLTAGIILGGFWAYRQLGWGGYWAWDPVENASLLPWLTGTAFLHSLSAFERRGRFRLWTASLLGLTFYLTIVATWMTRSGVVRSVHAFAGGPIGTWLLAFLFALAGLTVFALAYGSRSLVEAERRARADSPESWLSREAAFQVANVLFLVIGAAVFALSFLPKISHDFFATTRTDADGTLYYRVTTPLFAALLALAGAGSALGWGRTPWAEIRRRLLVPLLLTAAFAGGLYAFFRFRGFSAAGGGGPALEGGDPAAFYPTGLLLVLAFFLAVTAAPRPPFSPRRLGAQVSHFGVAVLAAGIVVSSMFRVTETHVLPLGESGRVGPYLVTPVSKEASESPRPGEPYAKAEVLFRVTRASPDPLPGSSAAGARPSELVADLRAERRYYPKKDQWASEVAIRRGLWEDVYLYFSGWDAEGRIAFVVYLNPFMALVYLGSIVFVLGGILALVPSRASPTERAPRAGARSRGGPRAAAAGIVCAAATLAFAPSADAGVLLRARVYDGEASSAALRSAVRSGRELSESLKVPVRDAEVEVELASLLPGSPGAGDPRPLRTWRAKTGGEGELVLDTGLDSFPEGCALVLRDSAGGRPRYSPFFVPREGGSDSAGQPVHIYPATESSAEVRAELRVAYELERGDRPTMIVRIALEIVNAGGALYVGRRSSQGAREIWRVPLARGAQVFLNRGPDERETPGWKATEDGRWLVLDAPIPGLCDLRERSVWEAQYRVPARQNFVQTFPVPVALDRQRLTVWAPAGDLALQSAKLRERYQGISTDPFSGEEKDVQVIYNGEPIPAGASVRVAVSADNAALGQVSLRSALLVGAFLAVIGTALVLGLLSSPAKGREP